MENEENSQVSKSFPIVAIGASAGGLEALNELVQAIPGNSGLAYIIIQHLSPDHPSIMDKLLATHTYLPVSKIEDGGEIERDHIYVLPAGPSATIEKNRFKLHERDRERTLRTPIDQFFDSVAQEKGRAGFGVILSGTGSDGTRGIRSIKNAGGFAIVQESDSAQFPGMPDSAAATGLIDFVLKPTKIPEKLIEILDHRHKLESETSQEQLRRDIETALPDILAVIDDEDGHDFSNYKTGTLIRRVERRMTLTKAYSVETFIARLEDAPGERQALLNDFLIGVTRFFRDEEAFVTLYQEAILPMLDRDQSTFRVWVPGCATGEEAYSIAILIAEAMEASGDNRQWQIFGTDIDGAALHHARAGIYTQSQLEGLSEERREHFLVADNHGYQIAPALREHCVFAPHNLLQDPPFSKLDLISCRNLMIYLNAEVQGRIIPRFHYALNSGGFLFLGPSESLGKQDRFFKSMDREARLFQRDDEQETAFSTLTQPYSDTVRRERRLASSQRGTSMRDGTRMPEPSFEQKLLNFFARQAAPAFATVNSANEISYLSQRMSRYISPSQGEPSAALDQFLVRDLRLRVRQAVSEARETEKTVRVENVVVDDGADPHIVDIIAMILPFAEDSVFVTLQPVRTADPADLAGESGARSNAEREIIERELTATRRQLSATLASYETTEQKLKSSNEELLSMNEELQSSNEELETSREELQSINEELETVNAELTENNRQLSAANSDLRNLFDSTDIATVFLDQALCVRRFTPACRRLFGIKERDVGRSINDLKWKVSYDDLDADAAQVLDTLQPIEREVTIAATQEFFLMRIRPYRRTDDRIDGTVITFVDITERKRAERQLKDNADTLGRQYAELETLYRTTPVGLALLDREFRHLRINEEMAKINGYSVEEHIGKRPDELIPDVSNEVKAAQLRVLETGEPVLGIEVEGETPAAPGVTRYWTIDYHPSFKDDEVFALGCCVNEITDQKRLQKRVEETALRLEFALETGQLGVWEYDIASETTTRTRLHDAIFGYDETPEPWNFNVFVEKHVLDGDRERVRQVFDEANEFSTPYSFQCRIRRTDGSTRWIEVHGRPTVGETGELNGFLGTVQDISERKEAEEQQSLLLHELQHRVKNTMATTIAIVRFSAKRATSIENLSDMLQGRLQAISRTHDVLTASGWQGERLSDVLKREIAPLADKFDKRLTFTGDDPPLTAKQMLALSLAFHELATNAAKYGALSNDKGLISVRARLLESSELDITWRESEGPAATPPDDAATGFGAFLLRRVLGPDLNGTSEIEYKPKGIVWTARFPYEVG